MSARPLAVFLVNDDAFFASHRLDLGIALRDAGFRVVVAAGDEGGARAIEAAGLERVAVPFDRGGRSITRDARTLARVTDLYQRLAPTLVHHVTIKPVLYGSLAARAARVPAIVNAVSGLGFVFLDRTLAGRALRAGVTLGYRAALGRRAVTVFQNLDDRDELVRRGMVDATRTRIVRGSGADTRRFARTPMPVDERPLVVLPARLLRDKGVCEFVEAARSLRARGVRARFALVGSADSTNPARIRRDELDSWVARGDVEWLGHRTDMERVYQEASLVVLPSYREGMPLVLLEAAAVGRPTVTTDVPGCRDAIEDGVTGWLVPVRDATALATTIERALGDRAELCARGEAAARWVRERGLTRADVVAQHLAIYRELLGNRWPDSALDAVRETRMIAHQSE